MGGFFGGFAWEGYGYLVPCRSFQVRSIMHLAKDQPKGGDLVDTFVEHTWACVFWNTLRDSDVRSVHRQEKPLAPCRAVVRHSKRALGTAQLPCVLPNLS